MVKNSKLVYIMGSIIIGIITILGIIAALIFSGVWDGTTRNLVFSSVSDTKVYDGTELVNDGWKLDSGELKKGHVATAIVTGSQTDVGTSENEFIIYVTDRNGADVSEDYVIVCNPGTLTVEKATISIATPDKSKEYDGTELVGDPEEATITGDVGIGQKAVITYGGNSITEPGSIPNTVQVSIVDDNDEAKDRSANYIIETTFGDLTIDPIELTFVTGTTTRPYTGQPHRNERYQVPSSLLPGHTIDPDSVVFTCEQTDVGSYPNTVDTSLVQIVDGEGNDVSNLYNLNFQLGKLTIYHIELEIRTYDASKAYDGTPLTKDGYAITGDILSDHTVKVSVTGSRTVPGSASNTFIVKDIVDSEGNSVAHNYKISKVYGTLVVTGIITNPTNPDEPFISGGDIDMDGSGGESEETPLYEVFSPAGGDLYLKQESYSDYYVAPDGKTKWNTDYTYSGFSYNEMQLAYQSLRANASTITIRKLLGTAPFVIPYHADVINAMTDDTNGIYSFAYAPHTGEVPRENMLSGTTYASDELNYRTFVYNNYLQLPDSTRKVMQSVIVNYGLDYEDADIIKKVADLVSNYVNYDLAATFTNDVAVEFFMGADGAYCQHYATAGTALFRALGIPARYTVGFYKNVRANENTIVSSPGHAWVEVYIDGTGWIPVEVTGSSNSTNPDDGSGDGGASNASKFFIKPYDIYVEGNMSTIISGYNRTQLEGKDFNEFCKAQNYTYTFTVEGYQSGIGKAQSRITDLHLFDEEGKDITDDYEYNVHYGVMHVYVQELTVTTAGLTTFYDGNVHTISVNENNYSIDYGRWGSLIDGHEIMAIDFGAKLTEVGTVVNAIKTFKVGDGFGGDVTDYYKINYSYGKLVVKPREILITAGSITVPFSQLDGEVVCKDYFVEKHNDEITGDALALDHVIIVETSGSLDTLGRVDNVVDSYEILDALGRDVTHNYIVYTAKGIIKVYMD